jgi:hypothetical protein
MKSSPLKPLKFPQRCCIGSKGVAAWNPSKVPQACTKRDNIQLTMLIKIAPTMAPKKPLT